MGKKILVVLLLFLALLPFINLNKSNATTLCLSDILSTYYNSGNYVKKTTINFNEEATIDLATHFHFSTSLKRTTYYKGDSLWMSQDEEAVGVKYSYYSTRYTLEEESGILYGVTTNPYETDVDKYLALSGEGQNSVLEYFTTLDDIIKYDLNWDYNEEYYYTTDKVMMKYFLDFTAPCLYESIINTNLFDYKQATINVNSDGDLSLKLWVSSLDYGYIVGKEDALVDGMVVLSEAIIKNNEIKGTVVDTYPSLTNADVVTFNGNVYTYGGSPDGSNRTNSIYCYNVESNTLYELDVKLAKGSTSHRAVLHQGKVYIIGGLYGVRYDTIQVHDLVNQTIETLDIRLPFGINCFQAGIYNDKVYIAGGGSNGVINGGVGNFSTVYELDLKTFEFKDTGSKLPTVAFKGGWMKVDNYLYVIGGTQGPRLNTIYRYDMENNEVVTMNAKFDVQISQCRAVYDNNGNIYIYGGTVEPDNHLVDTIYKYNIASDTLTLQECKLPIPLANTCVARVGDATYILGGDNDHHSIILKHQNNEIIQLFEYKYIVKEEK